MGERNKRGGGRQREDPRISPEGRYASDEPWREERRNRYPDDAHAGDRERGAPGWGHGAGSAPRYSGSDSGESRRERATGGRAWEHYSRADDEGWSGRNMRDESASWDRGRPTGGFGSNRESQNAGESFGFGSGDAADRRGEFQDTDRAPNRPARRRGQGDWALATDNYSGRSPKDYRRSDDRIREEVCDRFTDDARLDPSDVAVSVENCEVTLTGTVSSRDQKRRAEDIAERVSGVRDVMNQIRVTRREDTEAGRGSTETRHGDPETRNSAEQYEPQRSTGRRAEGSLRRGAAADEGPPETH